MINGNFENEAHYITLLKTGDRVAFDVLYHFYSNGVYSKIISMTKLPEVADELVQDIFFRVWEKRGTIDPELSFAAWLYKIAQNAVYNHYRKLASDKKMQAHLLNTFAELYSHTEDYILNKERTALLDKAMEKLPTQRQIIFKLCRIEEKSYQEVAQILNISTSTVSNQLVKATKSVKDYVFFHSKEFLVFIIALYLQQ